MKNLEKDNNDLKLTVKQESIEAKKLSENNDKAKIILNEILNKKEEAEKSFHALSVRSQMMVNDADSLTKQIKVHEEDLNELKAIVKDENSELIKLNINLETEQRKLKEIVNQREDVKSKIQTLLVQKDTLTNEINALKGHDPSDGKDALKAYADLLEKSPSCLIKEKFENERVVADEFAVLEQFKAILRQKNIHFASRIVDAFHTSLKCQDINPLTVLAGVSGTGKTLLPMMYSEIIGLHCLVMPVQPRWDSPQDLFGFYNYLEKEYKATDLSRALLRFDPFNYQADTFSGINSSWVKDRMLIVLLDEMNLARTEYYFSEFLSKLELRRLIETPKIKTNREKAEIELDTGPGTHVSFRLWVPRNILFVGTMNEDETTQTLSDKVLDRANVLRFGKPDDHAQNTGTTQKQALKQGSFLSWKQWNSWCKKPTSRESWRKNIDHWTTELNQGLDKVGRPFGYRVQEAILQYVANYPNVNKDNRVNLAFADQIEQKIIPKLRGLDIGDNSAVDCLQRVETVIEQLGDSEFSQAFRSAFEESKGVGMFTWRGVTRTLT